MNARDRRYHMAKRWIWTAHRELLRRRVLSVVTTQSSEVWQIGPMPGSVDESGAYVQWLDGRGFVDEGPKWTPIRDLVQETPGAA